MSDQIINEIKSMASKVDAYKDNFDTLKADFVSRLEKANEQAKNSIDGIEASLKEEVKNLSIEITEVKKNTGALIAKNDSNMTAKDYIFKGLNDNTEKIKNRKGFSIALGTKDAAVMSSSNNLGGTNFVAPYNVPGAFILPYEQVHVRSIIPSSGLGATDKVSYIVDLGGNVGVDKTAEGATKPLSDRYFEKKTVLVSKVAHHFDIPEEMLDDNIFLTNAITTIGMQELLKKEDNLFLYNNGSGNEFDGLTVTATAFSNGTGTTLSQRYDILVAAATQIRQNLHVANFILMNPGDVAALMLVKNSQGSYIFPETISNGRPNILGIPIYSHAHVAAGDFLIGDRNQAMIWDRMGANVRFYDQNQDNAIKNLWTIVMEQRTTMTVYYPGAFVYGNFVTILD